MPRLDFFLKIIWVSVTSVIKIRERNGTTYNVNDLTKSFSFLSVYLKLFSLRN